MNRKVTKFHIIVCSSLHDKGREDNGLSAQTVEVLVVLLAIRLVISSTDVCCLISDAKYRKPNLSVMISFEVTEKWVLVVDSVHPLHSGALVAACILSHRMILSFSVVSSRSETISNFVLVATASHFDFWVYDAAVYKMY